MKDATAGDADAQGSAERSVVICRATPVNPDPRVAKIGCALQRAGYKVQVVGWNMGGDLPGTESVDGLHYERLRVRAQFGRGLRNLPHQVRWQWALFTWLARQRDAYQFIHACDFDTVLPALVCQALWGKQVIYDIFDVYADMLRRTPAMVKNAIRWLDKAAIEAAAAVILPDEARLEQIAPARPRRLTFIYNSPPDVRADLQPQAPGCTANSQLHLAYVGNLQRERGLFELLALLSRHPEWTLELAGFGPEREALQAEAQRLPNVNWHGSVPYQQALALELGADVLLATYDPALLNHRYSSPNKLFEAMMLGRPLLAARGTHMDRLVELANCGLALPYGDVLALEQALRRLQDDPALRAELGQNGRRAYEQSYAWERMEQRLLALYAQLGGA